MRRKRLCKLSTARREGPIRPGSLLYRMLQMIADEIVKALSAEAEAKPFGPNHGKNKKKGDHSEQAIQPRD